ncbi:4'-phosphopantetheinyl transferase superfamily protein [Thiotrichales bacterium 19S11-10]|nr:4'-phosphopantetheinyl transferase superfamily protein [Thiotrichales bacterium 19S11-10]
MLDIYCLKFNDVDVSDIPLQFQTTQFKSNKRQKEHNLSQMLRYDILSKYLGIDKKKLKFQKGDNNRPFILNDQGIDFNISHSRQWLVIAITDQGKIGIDIETISPKRSFLAIAKQFFSAIEVDFLSSLSEADCQYYFYLIWTLKEARLKATGEGISNQLKETNFVIEKNKIKPVQQVGFHYFSFKINNENILSVCLEKDQKIMPSTINTYQWRANGNLVKENFKLIAIS